MATREDTVHLQHKLLGPCQLVRTEGVLWVVRQLATNSEYRIPPTRRSEFSCIEVPSDRAQLAAALPSVPDDSSEGLGTSREAATQLMPAPGADMEPTVPSTPEDLLNTDPALWSQLEAWIRNDVRLDARHVVFCRRILRSRLAGLRVTPREARDAGRLLSYAARRGFRPESRELDRQLLIPAVTFDSDSVASVRPSTWYALKDWAEEAGVFTPQAREFCTTFGRLRERRQEISSRHFEAAAKILNRSLELGFAPSRVEFEAAFEGTCSQVEQRRSAASTVQGAPRAAIAVETEPASRPIINADPRLLRRVMQSLRTGLPPTCSERPFATGFEQSSKMIEHFLRETEDHGSAVIIRGAYGQGKTFTLGLVEELARERGFAVARAEVDATENKLDKPQHIYRSLMANLRLPGFTACGGHVLAEAACRWLADFTGDETTVHHQAGERRAWLQAKLECEPLAWLLSDPNLLTKPQLLALLAGEKLGTVSQSRAAHVLSGGARDWPTFFAGTQGDVGSYLLAGVGVLCRLLGFKGLIIILDEMEKWQDLDWKAQSRAGNLLGGLIWGATAEEGRRECRKIRSGFHWQGSVWNRCDHPSSLEHSGWCGGFPFTTSRACHLGVAIAMTPRGYEGPELAWKNFGPLDFFDLPRFDKAALIECFRKLSPFYTRAYELPSIPSSVCDVAYARWRDSGDLSTRNGIMALVAALDEWRDHRRKR